MAGMAGYDQVYRGRSLDHRQFEDDPDKYYNRGMLRPLPLEPSLPLLSEDLTSDNDIAVKKSVGIGCGIVSLITENLLIHPFIVLRRQCQVNPRASTYHLVPITLIPVIVRLHQTQGLSTLWKGIGSVLLVRGLTLAVEDVISKLTPWPKEINSECSIKAFGQHLLLKCVSIGIVAPFYSASLVETVQSEIASEKPGILDVFRDGAIRLLEVGTKGRIIPIYALLAPHIAYGVAKYLFSLIVKSVASRIMCLRDRHSQERTGAYSRDLSEGVMQDIELHSTLISMCAADVLFYPLETVVHRLHLQGTRTIIDNLDNGRSVMPLLTGYSGAIDCYRTIVSTEGTLGLYKGFGALVLQFGIHFLVLKATKYILTEIGTILKTKPKVVKTQQNIYYNEG
ncbi:mitochondrial outer membrane protein SLC25A46-like [Microplitis mediator]|uniref:mitochondrial outer membrane protein SLC25A46-like n=1 Tax=Microplitis mediator TaxID=375433 RepID=UPI0025562BAE|nr:mitochondrial outer membrane protein SLC25A46-like [Microplitis mediator]